MYSILDAAHCHSPAGGQGMNLGLQDGEFILLLLLAFIPRLILYYLANNLAWKLSAVLNGHITNVDELFDSYDSEVRYIYIYIYI
jgi:2-polyprenyl-6-methoxyphenol hydroxylase-like FAD-dependent oxidoreductase